jgi:hypothetical protein
MQPNLLSHLLGEELYKHFLISFLFGASVLFLDSESSECQPGQGISLSKAPCILTTYREKCHARLILRIGRML